MRTGGFTLLEVIVVVVIIGILATLAITHYSSYKESALDKEAKADLKLIRSAERIYKMEVSTYYPSSGSESTIVNINNNLKLDLPAGANRNWDYLVKNDGCSQATRFNGPDSRSWFLAIADADGDPDSGTCP